MKTLGIGMVGARYGARMHLANFSALPAGSVELRGVCSRSKESAEAFARDAKVGFITDDFDALLARKDIDVVDLCVPPARITSSRSVRRTRASISSWRSHSPGISASPAIRNPSG